MNIAAPVAASGSCLPGVSFLFLHFVPFVFLLLRNIFYKQHLIETRERASELGPRERTAASPSLAGSQRHRNRSRGDVL